MKGMKDKNQFFENWVYTTSLHLMLAVVLPAQTNYPSGGSPGLVVMGDDSRSRGHGFESQHHILDGQDIFPIDLLLKLCRFV